MPLTAAEICTLARQTARAPGFSVQSGQLLNAILSDLCQNHDFDLARKSVSSTLNPSQINAKGQAFQNLPADYLRMIWNECYYTISGVPYPMIPVDLAEFDMMVQQAGVSGFPTVFATQIENVPPLLYMWPV